MLLGPRGNSAPFFEERMKYSNRDLATLRAIALLSPLDKGCFERGTIMRVGVLTGGGDCPGLNAAIRAIVRCAAVAEDEIIGFHHGWRGVVEREMSTLTTTDTKGILQSGGTILHTDRY